jgi:hypothetical protein
MADMDREELEEEWLNVTASLDFEMGSTIKEEAVGLKVAYDALREAGFTQREGLHIIAFGIFGQLGPDPEPDPDEE